MCTYISYMRFDKSFKFNLIIEIEK